MTQRILALLATLPLAASIAQAGSPLIKLNDDGSANIMFTGTASATYNDNIFYQNNKDSDLIYSIAPGLELNVGGDGNSKFTLTASETFNTYSDFSDLNNNVANINALYVYDAGSRFKGRVGAGFTQQVQPTILTAVQGDIVETTNLTGQAIGEYKLTEKSSIETGVRYNGIRYTSYENIYNDQDSVSVPVTWLYSVTDKLFAGFTYQYTFTDLAKADAPAALEPGKQTVNFVGLTLRGQATEKLSVETNAGIGFLSITDRALGLGGDSDQTTFNFSLSANYAISEKLSAVVTGTRSFSAGAVAQGVTTTEGRVGLNYAISEAWVASAYTGLANQKYDTGGKDDIFTAGASASYIINKYWRTTLSYSYMNDNTGRPGVQDFDNNIIALSASVRY